MTHTASEPFPAFAEGSWKGSIRVLWEEHLGRHQEAGFQGLPLCHGHPLSLFLKMGQRSLSFTALGSLPQSSELDLCAGAWENRAFDTSKPLSCIFKGVLLQR